MILEQNNLQIYFLCLSFIFILYLSSRSAHHHISIQNYNRLIGIDGDAAFYLPNLQKVFTRLNKYYDASKQYIFGSYVKFEKACFLGGGGGY